MNGDNNSGTQRSSGGTRTSQNDSLSDENLVKNIYVHRNGDVFSAAKKFVWNRRQLRTWDAFLEQVTEAVKPRSGPIQRLCTPHTGTRIQSFDDLQPHMNYVAVPAGEKWHMIDYLNLAAEQDALAKRRRHNANSIQSEQVQPVVHSRIQVSGRIKHEMQKRGKTIYIYRNRDEFTRAISVLLKPLEQRDLQLIFHAIEERVVLPYNQPIRKLYTLDGQRIIDPDELSEGQFYVASGPEPFEQRVYGQALPHIVCGKLDRDRIRYLNAIPTPPEGQSREKAHSNGVNGTPRGHQPMITARTAEDHNGNGYAANGHYESRPYQRGGEQLTTRQTVAGAGAQVQNRDRPGVGGGPIADGRANGTERARVPKEEPRSKQPAYNSQTVAPANQETAQRSRTERKVTTQEVHDEPSLTSRQPKQQNTFRQKENMTPVESSRQKENMTPVESSRQKENMTPVEISDKAESPDNPRPDSEIPRGQENEETEETEQENMADEEVQGDVPPETEE